MKVLITGATGFIGSALCAYMLKESHQVYIVSRQTSQTTNGVCLVNNLSELPADIVFDTVINLCGEPIANKRWNDRQKQRIVQSRLESTQNLVRYFNLCDKKPKVFISASAIGVYGVEPSDDRVSDNHMNASILGDKSFSSELCQLWEMAANKAQCLGIRTCLLRTGIVLGKSGGALGKMILPFKLGLGGKIGSGTQWMPWIHIDDLIQIIIFLIHTESLQGPINATAPNPVTNSDFTKGLGRALNRPTILPMPSAIIKLLMGQMGEELLLAGKKVVPEKLLNAGYSFQYTQLEAALSSLLKKNIN